MKNLILNYGQGRDETIANRNYEIKSLNYDTLNHNQLDKVIIMRYVKIMTEIRLNYDFVSHNSKLISHN